MLYEVITDQRIEHIHVLELLRSNDNLSLAPPDHFQQPVSGAASIARVRRGLGRDLGSGGVGIGHSYNFV